MSAGFEELPAFDPTFMTIKQHEILHQNHL